MTTKTNKAQVDSGRQYGLLTMISMVVGVVIGSGIFVRNEKMYATTQSALINISA